MKMSLIIGVLAFAPFVMAEELSNQDQCKEWAVMDGISSEDLPDYLKECLYSLEVPEEDPASEEEITTAEADYEEYSEQPIEAE